MKRAMPQGFRPATGDSRPRVAVVFDEDLFERVKDRAVREGKGFSEMVRELCQIGLFDLEESDHHEVAA
jgi:hypothetical protein